MARQTEIERLTALVRECQELAAAADKLALETAKRLDRYIHALSEFRRDVRSHLASVRIRVGDLELGRPVRATAAGKAATDLPDLLDELLMRIVRLEQDRR